MNPTIEEARELVAKHLASIESPRTASEILNKIKKSYQDHMDCGCEICIIKGAMEAETYTVIEEALKMTAESSENGIAGLIYRLHQSRDLGMEDYARIHMKREVKRALMERLVGSLLGRAPGDGLPPDMPPELKSILMGGGPVRPRQDGPLLQAIEVPDGEKAPEPPPGYIALEGQDALDFIKASMSGEDIPAELRERLEREAEKARKREESADSDSE